MRQSERDVCRQVLEMEKKNKNGKLIMVVNTDSDLLVGWYYQLMTRYILSAYMLSYTQQYEILFFTDDNAEKDAQDNL